LALYRLFLGRYKLNFQVIIFSCPSTDVPSFVEKYPKIKYAISDRPPWRQLDLCETSFLLLNGWIALKLKNILPKMVESKNDNIWSAPQELSNEWSRQ
jgi:hypothetical protein